MVEPKRRRKRPAVSCALCRQRKLRCNREHPCSNCLRSRNAACVYEGHYSPGRQPPQGQMGVFLLDPKPREPAAAAAALEQSSASEASTARSYHPDSARASSTNISTPASHHDRESLAVQNPASPNSRAGRASQQLSKATPTSVQSSSVSASKVDIQESRIPLGGTFHFHHESSLSGRAHPSITRSVTHKTRLFGQSHLINMVQMFRDILGINGLHSLDKSFRAFTMLQKCKSLARSIKAQRAPPWPTPLTRDLPQKDVADKLVDCYLQTFEVIYRILHLPSFTRDYEELWVPGTRPDMVFLVQLKLVMVIGATAYDGQFSLRASALRWVYEAQTWISEPEFKARLGIPFIQINLLLLLARESVGVGGDSVWVSAGDVLRRAMSMGLHRDPAHLPKRTDFAAEMHRRLWNTILEVALKTSSVSGGPPLISLDDFDTEPPGNLDDEQLMAEDFMPKPEDEFTQVSIAIALRKTFPARLAVTKFLNDLSPHGTHEEILSLDVELRTSYKTLCRTLQGFKAKAGRSTPSALELRIVDFIMHRYISSLHIPFFIPALQEMEYAFSRKLVVETALKMWCAVHPSSSIMTSQSQSRSSSSSSSNGGAVQDDLLERLACCGPGFYRISAVQASLLIAAELSTQLKEEHGLGPAPLRTDLLAVVNEAKAWCLHCIKIGETNIKGYLFICIIAAQIDGLMRGVKEEELPTLLVKAAEEAVDTCVPIMETMAGQDQDQDQERMDDGGGAADERAADAATAAAAVNAQPGGGGGTLDWDFLMSDALFAYNPGTAEPISWMFNDGTQSHQGVSNW